MNRVCESCGLPIRDGERLSLFQTHHEPFVICIRRLREENERLRNALCDVVEYGIGQNIHHTDMAMVMHKTALAALQTEGESNETD